MSVTKETKHRSEEFVVISGFDEEIENLENARGHDVWKTIGFSIASIG